MDKDLLKLLKSKGTIMCISLIVITQLIFSKGVEWDTAWLFILYAIFKD
jgi:hypothetical protein